MTYTSTAVKDADYSLSVSVEDGDDLIYLVSNKASEVRMTVDEALATIVALGEAVQVAIRNQ